MTTRSAEVRAARARRPAISRRTRVRRRRALIALALAAGVAVAAALLAPLFGTAVKELTLPLRHEDVIRQQASEKGLDPALIAGVIYAESKFADRTSSAGAQGLMQILPETARFIARRSGGTRFRTADLADPEVNIRYGSYYLRYLLDRHGGSEVLALASYNAGETNVARWIARARAAGREFTVDDIPFPETRAYVERVLGARDDYRREYASELGLG